MFAYRVLQRLLRFLAGIFYRQIDVVGLEHVPPEGQGAVVFAGNHPNSLLDPVLIIAFGGRIVHFAAKDVLFQSPILRFFLRHLGAVPVARKADHGDAPLDNQHSFDHMFRVLVEGRAIGIFPEGLSHDASQLSRLKTGAARIVLGVSDFHTDVQVRLIPCGLNYVRRRRFRSRVLLQFGPPIEIGPSDVAAYREDPKGAVRALTETLEKRIRGLTINAPDWETLRVLDGVRRLYQPQGITLEQRAELSRRFSDVYEQVKDRPEVIALFAQVRDWLDRLRAVGLSDRDLRQGISTADVAARLGHHLWLMLVWLPLAIPGALIHVPLGLLVGFAGSRLSPRKDVIATTKFVGGLLLMVAAFGAILGGVSWAWGWRAGLATGILLPLSGLATLQVLERGTSMKSAFGTLLRLLRLREDVVALRDERARLEAEVLGAVDRMIPADMVRLFPGRTG